jgi:peptidoglycan/xylan/chitin deacetylase (PgdA/CDA1 family)
MNPTQRLYPYRSIPILLYHRVAATNPKEQSLRLSVSPKTFDRQMRYIHEHGFTTISLDKYLDLINKDPKPKQKYIMITFDDGFLDNYTDAFPILMKYGLTASIFLVSDYMGKIKTWGTHKNIRLMNWEQAREMSHHAISFQSHTSTHPDLIHLTDDNVISELVDSKTHIEDKIGLPVNHFAYPYGRWNLRLIELVKKVRYQSAYASGIAEIGRFSIERFECYESFWDFKIKTSSFGSWLRNIYNLPKDKPIQ